MKFCKLIKKKYVLPTAMKLVRSAKKQILVTMNVDEEVVMPLPTAYNNLIELQVANGIKVMRYGYGTKRSYGLIEKRSNKRIIFNYVGELNNYQRLLLVDKSKGIFSVNGAVFYTEFKPLITCLVKFVKTGYNSKTYESNK